MLTISNIIVNILERSFLILYNPLNPIIMNSDIRIIVNGLPETGEENGTSIAVAIVKAIMSTVGMCLLPISLANPGVLSKTITIAGKRIRLISSDKEDQFVPDVVNAPHVVIDCCDRSIMSRILDACAFSKTSFIETSPDVDREDIKDSVWASGINAVIMPPMENIKEYTEKIVAAIRALFQREDEYISAPFAQVFSGDDLLKA